MKKFNTEVLEAEVDRLIKENERCYENYKMFTRLAEQWMEHYKRNDETLQVVTQEINDRKVANSLQEEMKKFSDSEKDFGHELIRVSELMEHFEQKYNPHK